jgi:3-hydroxyisobutyrate dehydrogenase-like beta-hydroxyacid dehydrogenase
MSQHQTASMIGKGDMGAALAGALIDAGHDLTVWNRSDEKYRALADRGAAVASSVGDALSRSEVVVVC